MNNLSKVLTKRIIECMDEAAKIENRKGDYNYHHGMAEAFNEVIVMLEKTKLDHDHECYWKDRVDVLEQLVDDWVPTDLRVQIKRRMANPEIIEADRKKEW